MDIAAEILVIILSVVLAVFLVVGIVLVIYLISLTRQIRKVTKSAEGIVNDVGSIVGRIAKITSPLFMMEFIGRFFNKLKKKKEGK